MVLRYLLFCATILYHYLTKKTQWHILISRKGHVNLDILLNSCYMCYLPVMLLSISRPHTFDSWNNSAWNPEVIKLAVNIWGLGVEDRYFSFRKKNIMTVFSARFINAYHFYCFLCSVPLTVYSFRILLKEKCHQRIRCNIH